MQITLTALNDIIRAARFKTSISPETEPALNALTSLTRIAHRNGYTELTLPDISDTITGTIQTHDIEVTLMNHKLPADNATVDVIRKQLKQMLPQTATDLIAKAIQSCEAEGLLNTQQTRIEAAIRAIENNQAQIEAILDNAEALDKTPDEIRELQTELDTCDSIVETWNKIKTLPKDSANKTLVAWNIFSAGTSIDRIYRWFFTTFNLATYF